VRATVQFYQATSNGVVASADMRRFAEQIRKLYKQADYVGSLVVPSTLDKTRPTNWDGASPRPAGITWSDFPGLMERTQNQCGFPQYMTPIETGVTLSRGLLITPMSTGSWLPCFCLYSAEADVIEEEAMGVQRTAHTEAWTQHSRRNHVNVRDLRYIAIVRANT
jgi:hypothetical protein